MLFSSEERAEEGAFDAGWRFLELAGLSYEYESGAEQDGFRVGPIDLRIERGQVVFLVGGNGSGKTTLLKLLMGLYAPSTGQVLIDEQPLVPCEEQRELFGGVLSDYHLFRWVEEPDETFVSELLTRVRLAQKVTVKDGEFSSLDFSKGQRARLALVAALAERRGIYVFDEWAADQDPEFREFFYLEMLPRLKEQGVTVVAATHDDRYFHVADQIIRLDRGKLLEA
jgi:putative ATP-binding cassette transporter